MPDPTIEILDPGALTTVQDLGRPGHAHLGVPRSGALDEPALRLANRLVGNEESAAVLETTLTGVSFRATQAGRLAVTGAACTIRVAQRSVAWGAAVPVPAGAVVEVGAAALGLRSYVALAGGVAVVPVLGSRSTDLLSGLGPPPLRTGDVLPLGAPGPAPSAAEVVRRTPERVLRLDLGPRADWFTEEALDLLDGGVYTVGAASNRIGLRLAGPVLARRRDAELATEPMVLGAVQVPPNGQPVVFLHDHPTTGGYPVIGVVRSVDLAVCAQARPGDHLTLRVLDG
ncbi:biotin-dependent carboxyltransferase [Nocardioides marmoriginsengisoli]|uniref:Biotin-dependent carboxyltransferase n=1 Tax=Nocardioides marmoriginsengisoli TaxID=661483 RepID=A0A3N0CPF3_9ACTN|nr:biotin-dependent carboxyltransferase family protein [Nocardioides marmoriginsengisoli]RNL64916.1 biotin-dependent carboxyltransferase [Nocardioides marmoriginsengisoli]